MEKSSRATIKLPTTNYTLSKPQIEDFLSYKYMFNFIESKGKNLDPSKEAEWKKLNRKTIKHS